MMAERLHITGRGRDRETALADADEQARAYYGGLPYVGELTEASCQTIDMRNIMGEGRAMRAFEIEVVYRLAAS